MLRRQNSSSENFSHSVELTQPTTSPATLRYNELRWPNTKQADQRILIRHPHQLPRPGSRRSWHGTRSALIPWTSSKQSSPTSARSTATVPLATSGDVLRHGLFHGEPVMVIGNLKGRTLKERVARKFGSPDPEGYRKALRVMKIAEKFGRPVFTFIDLAGAYPGIGAEERGQGEAIARNLLEMSRLRVPTIATITGEGGSGGALALAVADRVLMLENAIYSVISPEGCASIMWKDASKKQQAAAALKYTASDVDALGCVDDVLRRTPTAARRTTPPPPSLWSMRGSGTTSTAFALSPRSSCSRSVIRKFRNIAQFYTTA